MPVAHADTPGLDLASTADFFPNATNETAQLRVILSSLVVRAAYGGMAGDVALMHSAVVVWSTRFFSKLNPGLVSASEGRVWQNLFKTRQESFLVCL
jgi:hypothetical protein